MGQNTDPQAILKRVKLLRAYFEHGLEEATNIERDLAGLNPPGNLLSNSMSENQRIDLRIKSMARRGIPTKPEEKSS